MDSVEKFAPALGRILLGLLFVVAGYGKIWAIDATATQMASHGIPLPNLLVYGAVALELGGGLMLMAGLLTRFIALVFAFYVLILAMAFHNYWAAPAAAQHAQQVDFLHHLAIIGGMIYVFVYGAGSVSLDALLGLAGPRPSAAIA